MPRHWISISSLIFVGCNEQPEEKEYENLPPYSPIIDLTPVEAYTTDDIEMVLLNPNLEDPNGDSVSLYYEWFLNEVKQPNTEYVINSAVTEKGQTWTVQAYTTDGSLRSMPSIATVVVLNSPPVIGSVIRAPESPLVSDDLTVEAVNVSDSDGDAVSITQKWFVDGQEVPEYENWTTIPAAETQKNQSWLVQVIPNDGEEDGPSHEVRFDIGNTAPVIHEVSFNTTEIYKDTFLQAQVDWSDVDGDTITFDYAWKVNNVDVFVDDDILPNEYFSKGDKIGLTVIGSDGLLTSNMVVSEDVFVQNSLPTINGVVVSPDPAYTTDSLSCVHTGVADIDGDQIAVDFYWTVAGQGMFTGETLDSSYFSKGDEVFCFALPNDGDDEGFSAQDSIIIQNTPPVMSSLSLSPQVATVESSLFCSAQATDDDNDMISFSYVWTRNGVTLPHTDSYISYQNYPFSDYDEVTCSASPSDGSVAGNVLVSGSVTLLPSVIDVEGTLTLKGVPVGGVDIVSQGSFGSFSTTTNEADGSYNISVGTLSNSKLYVDFEGQTNLGEYSVDIANGDQQVVDFEIRGSAFPTGADQYEPDNDSSSASTLAVGTSMQHRTLWDSQDEDWIEVNLVENQPYDFFTTNLYWTTNAAITLYDDALNEMAFGDYCLFQDSCVVGYVPPHTGVYYLRVASYPLTLGVAEYFLYITESTDVDLDGWSAYYDCDESTYAFGPWQEDPLYDNVDNNCDGVTEVSATDLDNNEPNDNISTASPLSLVLSTHPQEIIFDNFDLATFHSSSDIDFYSFEMPAKSRYYLQNYHAGSLRPGFINIYPDISYDYVLYDDQQNTIDSGTQTDLNVVVENTESVAKTFYLSIAEPNQMVSSYLVYFLDAGLDLDEDGYYSKEEYSILDPHDGDANIIP